MIVNNTSIKYPVFIMGAGRSGTTFLGSILGAHNSCVVTPESQFKFIVEPVFEEDGKYNASKTFEKIQTSWHLKKWEVEIDIHEDLLKRMSTHKELIYEIVREYSHRIYGESPSLNLWIDHTPNNGEYIEFLRTNFPGAKFIHIIRDGRGVASSHKGVNWGPDNILESACHWMKKISYGLAAQSLYPNEVIMVRYEDILKNPENEIRRLCDFIGIDYEDKMIEGDGFVVPEYTKKQHKLVGQKPDRSNVDSWKKKLSNREIEIFEYETGRMLSLLGYESVYKDPRRATKLEKIIFYLEKRNKRIRKEINKFKSFLFKRSK